MDIKTDNVIPPAATTTQLQKQVYTTPIFRVYGAVHQFTQGSRAAMNDAVAGMTFTSSERELKENIVRVGLHPLGVGLYLFDYKPEFKAMAGDGRRFGVMVDEIEAVMPEAVVLNLDGYKRVNYQMLGIDLSPLRLH